MKRIVTVAGKVFIGIAFVVATSIAAFWLTDRDGWNKRHFDRIVPGMTRAELLAGLREEPDCIVRVRRSEAWFYRGAMGSVPCQTAADNPAALPTAYGTLQILVGPDGRVRAVAIDGERYLRIANGGSLPASTLQALSVSDAE
jgi:hypothetical protein